MAKVTELREMSDEQLRLTLKDSAESLFRLRIQAQTERLDAPSELRKQRRLIARIKTIQWERARAAQRLSDTETATEMYQKLVDLGPDGGYGDRAAAALRGRASDESVDEGP